MTEKELKKLNRYQLLELLLLQTERANKLQARLAEAEEKLYEKELKMTSLGSIAEAALQVSGVFQAAQDAADLYIRSAQQRAAQIEEDARKQGDAIVTQALAEAHRIKGEGNI